MGQDKKEPAGPVMLPQQPAIQRPLGNAKRTGTEREATNLSHGMTNAANRARTRQMNDYNAIMKGYRGWGGDVSNLQGSIDSYSPHQFSFERVNARRPGELDEAYGFLREAAPGYREFAQTGGYSDKDIRELRARGISPIRSAYSGAIRDIDRARALGGAGGSPNYIAARSRAQRELPGQIADAMTGVNAQLAQDIRQGRLAGLSGLTGLGSTMGGLSSAEAGRMLQADLANQAMDVETQKLTEQGYDAQVARQMAVRQLGLQGLNAQTGLYGTTPAMAATFGSQALQGLGLRGQLEGQRQNYGLGLMDQQLRQQQLNQQREMFNVESQRAWDQQQQQNKGTPWWKTALGVIGTVAPYVAAPFTGGTSLIGALPGATKLAYGK